MSVLIPLVIPLFDAHDSGIASGVTPISDSEVCDVMRASEPERFPFAFPLFQTSKVGRIASEYSDYNRVLYERLL